MAEYMVAALNSYYASCDADDEVMERYERLCEYYAKENGEEWVEEHDDEIYEEAEAYDPSDNEPEYEPEEYI